MATDRPDPMHDQWDECPDCGRPTVHSVYVKIRTESTRGDTAEFSREPYRVTECLSCGRQTTTRMSDVDSA